MREGFQMEIVRIAKEIYETKKRLNIAASEIFTLARERAETEKAYKIALRHEILKLKTEGYPATLIMDLAKGSEHVADLRFQRDLAKTKYDSGRDSMRVTETEGNLLQTIAKYQDEIDGGKKK
jgi:hypothetical protein